MLPGRGHSAPGVQLKLKAIASLLFHQHMCWPLAEATSSNAHHLHLRVWQLQTENNGQLSNEALL